MYLTRVIGRLIVALYIFIGITVGAWFLRNHYESKLVVEVEKREQLMTAILSCINEAGMRFEYGWGSAIEVVCKRSEEWKDGTYINYLEKSWSYPRKK